MQLQFSYLNGIIKLILKKMEWLNLAASSFWRKKIPVHARRGEFQCTFGCSPDDCVVIWRALVTKNKVKKDIKPVHILWLLFFLKHYNVMNVNGQMVGVSEKTYRNKVFHLIDALASLVSDFVCSYLKWLLRPKIATKYVTNTLFYLLIFYLTD